MEDVSENLPHAPLNPLNKSRTMKLWLDLSAGVLHFSSEHAQLSLSSTQKIGILDCPSDR